jgi:hypothetical protein
MKSNFVGQRWCYIYLIIYMLRTQLDVLCWFIYHITICRGFIYLFGNKTIPARKGCLINHINCVYIYKTCMCFIELKNLNVLSKETRNIALTRIKTKVKTSRTYTTKMENSIWNHPLVHIINPLPTRNMYIERFLKVSGTIVLMILWKWTNGGGARCNHLFPKFINNILVLKSLFFL